LLPCCTMKKPLPSMAASVGTPVWVGAPAVKSVCIPATWAPAPIDVGLVLVRPRLAAPAGVSCSLRMSWNSTSVSLYPSVLELATLLPMVSSSVCMVAMPESAAVSDRTVILFCFLSG